MQKPPEVLPRPNPLVSAFYVVFNICVSASIVFANKWVFAYYKFEFVFALTWIHTIFTFVGMRMLAYVGFFTPKPIPAFKVIPLAAGFVGYIVLCNVSLNLNSVGFYQIMKVAISPVLVVMEFLMFGKRQSKPVLCSVFVVCVGVTIATVTDKVVVNNITGLVVGIGATLITALYQIWVGSKQVELQATSSQLLLAYTPHAIWLLGILVPTFEPMGWQDAAPGTLLGYTYTTGGLTAIFISAILGVFVSLSTFLVIGATSSLTYNVVGHIKTAIILVGGIVFFDDSMSRDRMIGISIAMLGIAWYTKLVTTQPSPAAAPLAPAKPLAKMAGGPA